jgi:predicted DCC family thiol-disulfide oxidoreductase YuxK
MSPEPPIIFFDGVCGLCNWWVDRLIARDDAGEFRFAPLQGETARAMGIADTSINERQWTIVLVDEDGTWRRSTATLRIARRVGGLFGLARVLQLIPRPLRDTFYRLITCTRYQFFGKRETCRMPTEEERDRFLP